MLFSQKLNLLMIITNTTNSSLARSISLDPSFVSRIRRGLRTPSQNQNYIKSMALYFARNCSGEYQRTAISQALKVSPRSLTADNERTAEIIQRWLLDEGLEDTRPIESFIEGFSQFKFKKTPKTTVFDFFDLSQSIVCGKEVFYGIEGKQSAVINFLYQAIKDKSPQTLLLYSDEDLEWLTSNAEFTAKWAALLFQLIMNGNKIKIIHTVNRSLDEMLTAIKEWLPIYMTGSIEPYYYPKARDGVFKRTLFIAPNTAAVASTSIGNKSENTANFLYTDKDIIRSLINEYYSYLSLCRPLMRIFTSKNNDGYLFTLEEFETEEANSILKASILSNITMPVSIADNILSSIENDTKEYILSYHKKRISNFEIRLNKHRHTEIIHLPDIKAAQQGYIKVDFSDMLNDTQLFYTLKDFTAHLENVTRLMKAYDNYNVSVDTSLNPSEYMLYVKEDVGILVAKITLPTVIFAINENNMTAAFWDYINTILGKITKGKLQKKQTIAKLEEFIDILKRVGH